MSNTTFRRQGDPVTIGWTLGRAPLRLRGIRFVEGEGGAAPAGGQGAAQQPAGGENPPAATPAQVAAFYASQNGGQQPAPQQSQAPAQPAAPVQGFTPEQVQKLLEQNSELQKQFEQTQQERDAAIQERDSFKGELSQVQRERAVTTAADGKANASLLLDSSKFQAAVKDIDLTDTAALGAAVEQFVKDNPAYAAAPTGPALPNTSGGTPAGGSTSKPTTLEGAIAAALGG